MDRCVSLMQNIRGCGTYNVDTRQPKTIQKKFLLLSKSKNVLVTRWRYWLFNDGAIYRIMGVRNYVQVFYDKD